MKRDFSSFETTFFQEPFKSDNAKTEKTALIELKDEDGNTVESVQLGYVSSKELFDQLQQTGSINFTDCYIENINLEEYRRIADIAPKELILLNSLTLQNCFVVNSENDLDFSNIGLMGEPANFEQTTFSAPRITFENSKFHSGSISFEYALFLSENIKFNNVDFRDSDVLFKNAIFSKGEIDFSNSKFLGKSAIFTNVDFGEGNISFESCKFTCEKISFDVSRYGNGKKDFSRITFGDGAVNFDKAEFGSGNVLFRNTHFGNGPFSMARVDFGDGIVDFVNADFGNSDVNFTGSDFGNGKTNFKHAVFGHGVIDFHFAHFDEGDINFDRVQFGNGGIDFRAVEFGTGRMSFNRVIFGIGDIVFEASKLNNGSLDFKKCVFGQGKINFDSVDFDTVSLNFDDVDFGQGLVSFKKARFGTLTLDSCQINNFFDLRLAYCGKLDLSGTIIKDVIDIHPHEFVPEIKAIELAGIRLLGRIYIDWHQINLKKLIYDQDKSNRIKSEQFRLLKENFNVIGHYDEEDLAYIEFKRTYSKAILQEKFHAKPKRKLLYLVEYYAQLLVFDRLGHYATNPIRVLQSTLVIFLLFSLLFYLLPFVSDSDIHSSLFPDDDPRNLGPIAKALYHSVITFFTIGYGDYYPSGLMRILSGIEGFVGMFMMSYFTVAFVRKVLR